MATDLSKAKPTRYPGVYRMPDGRLLARAVVRSPEGRVQVRKQRLPEGATEYQAVLAVEALRQSLKAPTPTPPPRATSQTVEQYARQWLEVRSRRLSPATATTYEDAISNRILPRLGWMRCEDLTRQAIESWVGWIEAQEQPNGKPYTQDSMRKWFRVLKTLLRDMAADLELPDTTNRVRPPERPELGPVREQEVLEAEALGKLLAAAKARYPQHYACIATMSMTGARAGEVMALQWDAIDFERSRIVVKRSVSKGKLRDRTKTKTQRIVPMHPALAAILKEHHDLHPGTGLLFPANNGKPRIPSSMKKVWPILMLKAGIDVKIGSQVLRRGLNTALVLAGVDRLTTRAILGHTSEAMTQRYAGIGDAAKADAIGRVGPSPGKDGDEL